jgi:hypothetical protein
MSEVPGATHFFVDCRQVTIILFWVSQILKGEAVTSDQAGEMYVQENTIAIETNADVHLKSNKPREIHKQCHMIKIKWKTPKQKLGNVTYLFLDSTIM